MTEKIGLLGVTNLYELQFSYPVLKVEFGKVLPFAVVFYDWPVMLVQMCLYSMWFASDNQAVIVCIEF